jgi:glyoxylase-like metal-dependent hydrolase (beta-lactamase superfamily II)
MTTSMNIKVLDLHFLGLDHTIASFLIETSEGPILVEVGPHSTFSAMQSSLAAHGYQVSDVKHVFLTHIHLDHAGSAWAFAQQGATVYVHPSGYAHLNDPSKLMNSARMIYKDDMDRLWGEMHEIPQDKLLAVEHQQVFRIGDLEIQALHTPGHAIHHIAWKVGNEIFTGDVAGVKINGGPVVPPCPPPDINIEHWEASIQLLRDQNPAAIWLTHYGRIENVSGHLDALGTILRDWANWMKPYFESGDSVEHITPIFQAYTFGQLRAAGVSEADIQLYEAANPSWMSVTGLLRYWKKKTAQ